jgi:hypothetical protein
LRQGATAARGEVLLFLHADARLPPSARGAILGALADPRVVGGNFRVRFEPPTAWSRFFSLGYDRWRRWVGLFYGDSGIFVRRAVHDRLGGFPAVPVMEDHAFARHLGRVGQTAYVRDPDVRVSGRRYSRAPLRTLALWLGLHGLYHLGVPPERLARIYRDVR